MTSRAAVSWRISAAAVVQAALVALLFPALAQAGEVRAEDLIGMSVVADSGESLGTANDIVFDARSGGLRYFEVGVGGWFGFGGHIAAVAPGSLSVQDGTLTYHAAPASLGNRPPPGRVIWPDMRATDLLQREVRDRLHRDSGEIVDLWVDLVKGRVTTAVIDLRDDWKPGRRLVRVAIEKFSLPRDIGQFATLNIDRERLLTESD